MARVSRPRRNPRSGTRGEFATPVYFKVCSSRSRSILAHIDSDTRVPDRVLAMSVLKTLIKSLTPPPLRRRSKSAAKFSPEAEAAPVAAIKPLVEELVGAESQGTEQAITKLRQIASEGGTYQTATEIKKRLMEKMTPGGEAVSHNKSRGYELVSELYLQHLWEEIDAIEGKSRALGPGVFGGYCDEIVHCLFMSEHARRGVEVSLTIADELLLKAIDSFQYRVRYVTLAEQSVRSAATLVAEKMEIGEPTRSRAAQRRQSGEPSAPESRRPESAIDTQCVEYLKLSEKGLARISEELEHFDFASVTPVDDTPRERERAQVRNQLHYLAGLLDIARKTNYPSFTGAVLERVGTFREAVEPGQGRDTLLKAGKYYEIQGEYEWKLGFGELCRRKYSVAVDIFSKINDAESAQRVRSKLEEIGFPARGKS